MSSHVVTMAFLLQSVSILAVQYICLKTWLSAGCGLTGSRKIVKLSLVICI